MTATTKISYAQALGEAIRMEMHRNPDVVCIAADGVAARSPVTTDLAGAFGPDRIVTLETHARPVSVAAGMAANGLRVICEARAAQLGPDALAPLSELEPGAPGSVVLRVPDGGPELAGEDAPSIEGRLLDSPNLSVIAPGTPADAKGMLAGSIRGSGSFCVLEAEPLYATVDDVPEGMHVVEAGRATVAVRGERPRVSIVGYGLGARVAGRALELVEADAELVDLRSLRPLDREALAASVGRSGKVAVLEPAGSTRVAAEVAAVLLADAFEYLDGPLARIELPAGSRVEGDEGEAAARTVAERIDELVAY